MGPRHFGSGPDRNQLKCPRSGKRVCFSIAAALAPSAYFTCPGEWPPTWARKEFSHRQGGEGSAWPRNGFEAEADLTWEAIVRTTRQNTARGDILARYGTRPTGGREVSGGRRNALSVVGGPLGYHPGTHLQAKLGSTRPNPNRHATRKRHSDSWPEKCRSCYCRAESTGGRPLTLYLDLGVPLHCQPEHAREKSGSRGWTMPPETVSYFAGRESTKDRRKRWLR